MSSLIYHTRSTHTDFMLSRTKADIRQHVTLIHERTEHSWYVVNQNKIFRSYLYQHVFLLLNQIVYRIGELWIRIIIFQLILYRLIVGFSLVHYWSMGFLHFIIRKHNSYWNWDKFKLKKNVFSIHIPIMSSKIRFLGNL